MLTALDLRASIRLHRLLLHMIHVSLRLWSPHTTRYMHTLRHPLRIWLAVLILFLKLHCLLYILNLHLLEIQINYTKEMNNR